MKPSPIPLPLTSTHWGTFTPTGPQGAPTSLAPWPGDPSPNPQIAASTWEGYRSPLRVQRPAIREGWLKSRNNPASRQARGLERFIDVPWDEALDMVAESLGHTIATHGNASVFGGSYGWSSAGRFHHAQGQVHRFLNVLGGYVRSVDSYSLGAGRVLMPHVLATMDELIASHHDWLTLQQHTRLFVSFGGVPLKNAMVGQGGVSQHFAPGGLQGMAKAGCRFVNFSPVGSDLDVSDPALEWIPLRPHSDTAVMLALATEIILAGRHDPAFLRTYCVGFERWQAYLMGAQDGIRKDANWAAPLADVPAARLRALAMQLVDQRSIVNVAWSLQRADHGEQPFWAALGLACVIGQIGLPGGGLGFYGPVNTMGSPHRLLPRPTFPQGGNKVKAFIPVARIADMLESPGSTFQYNGGLHTYPHIAFIYWAGGNPFHHHQDLHRLARAWRKPHTVVVNEQFWNAHARMADVVLPATSTLERNDIGASQRDDLLIAMKALMPPVGEARDDYDIFAALATRLGKGEAFTEGRNTQQWLAHLYEGNVQSLRALGIDMPDFDTFWAGNGVQFPANPEPVVMFEAFRRDPVKHPLKTPSGKIEIFSETIAGFGLADCPGHPVWIAPHEWLGSALTARHPLHLLSDQPFNKLHSQLDQAPYSQANKIKGHEPLHMHPDDAGARGLVEGDIVKVFNDRGHCLVGLRLDARLRPGVVKLSNGAWWDPVVPGDPTKPDRHGNPNTLTRDQGASSLSQGCSAQSCLVEVVGLQTSG